MHVSTRTYILNARTLLCCVRVGGNSGPIIHVRARNSFCGVGGRGGGGDE